MEDVLIPLDKKNKSPSFGKCKNSIVSSVVNGVNDTLTSCNFILVIKTICRSCKLTWIG